MTLLQQLLAVLAAALVLFSVLGAVAWHQTVPRRRRSWREARREGARALRVR